MPKMTAAEAAVRVLEREGVRVALSVPGAVISGIRHILARHVEGASPMADGYMGAVAAINRVSGSVLNTGAEAADPAAR